MLTKQRKTREQKVLSAYRLNNFKLAASLRMAVKDASEFGYLSSEYVVKDLTKTFLYTAIIVALLMWAKMRLG